MHYKHYLALYDDIEIKVNRDIALQKGKLFSLKYLTIMSAAFGIVGALGLYNQVYLADYCMFVCISSLSVIMFMALMDFHGRILKRLILLEKAMDHLGGQKSVTLKQFSNNELDNATHVMRGMEYLKEFQVSLETKLASI